MSLWSSSILICGTTMDEPAKHGAFMGGADFVQWHGNYELLLKMTEIKEIAHRLREARAKN